MSKKNMESTRELMGTREVTDYSIRTYREIEKKQEKDDEWFN